MAALVKSDDGLSPDHWVVVFQKRDKSPRDLFVPLVELRQRRDRDQLHVWRVRFQHLHHSGECLFAFDLTKKLNEPRARLGVGAISSNRSG